MDCQHYEPALQEMLDDSLIQAVMLSDGVGRAEIEQLVDGFRRSGTLVAAE